tara:strand:- start:2192 stop:3148 length:957 start_codon:yes stop_codon:yes gene_type:complete
MKIAITGGSGFIGKYLIDALIKSNYKVNVLSRSEKESSDINLNWFKGDLNDRSSLKDFLKGCDLVCNCAGEISNSNNFKKSNLLGVKILHEVCEEQGVGIFIQLSSAGIYKIPSKGLINESSEIFASTEYERSKIDAEKWLFKQNKMQIIILRPTTVYGVDMPNQSLKSLFFSILNKKFFFIGSRKSISCYISVENVVQAILKVIDSKSRVSKLGSCEAYNLSHDIYYKDFISFSADALKIKGSIFRVPLHMILIVLWLNKKTFRVNLPLTKNRAKTLARKSSFSSEKFKKDFSWSPPYSHVESIKNCVKNWFKNQVN